MAVNYPGKPLRIGARGPAVSALQRQLNTYGGARLIVDGVFGASTAKKVNRWQARRGLGSDGVVDLVMWCAIFGLPAPDLHPARPESRLDRIRRLRVEMLARRRERKRLKDGRRKQAVIKRQRKVGKALKRLVRANQGPRVVGRNKVRGGQPGERFVFAAREALRRYQAGKRPSFYSQSGAWTVSYALTGEPSGFRSDCSQWVTSLFRTCGLPDPNGAMYTGGYTGTLATHGEEVDRARAMQLVREGRHPVLVIWDPWGEDGHVEALVSPQGDTIGHGSSPINAHTVETFNYKQGGPRFYVYEAA